MQISNQYHSPMKEMFNTKQDTQKESNTTSTEIQKMALIREKNDSTMDKSLTDANADSRQTYGLLVLELMSDQEYQAFQRATAGMNESDKIIAAQSLYSLNSFYSGKIQEKRQDKKISQNILKAYPSTQNQDFINRYKNALMSQSQIDLSS